MLYTLFHTRMLSGSPSLPSSLPSSLTHARPLAFDIVHEMPTSAPHAAHVAWHFLVPTNRPHRIVPSRRLPTFFSALELR